MKQNAAAWDRALRAVAGVVMLACSIFAPLPLLVRAAALGVGGAYLLVSALAGSCLGYRLMGISTCSLDPKGKAT
jgi:Protein of unknown function (DUF2892)